MHKIKTKKQVDAKKINRVYSEEDNKQQLKWLLIISLIIVVVFMAFYFLTKFIIEKRKNNDNVIVDNSTEVDDTILLTQMLKQSESEYYVFVELQNDPLIDSYRNNLVNYSRGEDSLPVYYVDMSKAMNKQMIADETQITDDVRDIRLAETALFHIVDGKIESYYLGSTDVLDQIEQLTIF